MSYDFLLYLRRAALPDSKHLSQELRTSGLTIPDSLDLGAADGFTPLGDTGFEILTSDVTAEEIHEYRETLREANEPDDEHLRILLASDTFMAFGCRDAREVAAAKVIAGAVAKLSNGYVCDPQTGEVVFADYLKEATNFGT